MLELTEAQRAELDRRLEAHRETPGETIPWETLRRDLLPGLYHHRRDPTDWRGCND